MCVNLMGLESVALCVKVAGVQKPAHLASFHRKATLGTEKLKMIRDSIKSAQVTAMKSGDKPRVAVLRLILAKIKDRDIELRTAKNVPDEDTMVIEVLQKLAKQRKESIEMFEQVGRPERAVEEQAELAVVEEFLPAQMGEEEMKAAILAIKTELGAASIKDMGRVMGELKARHASTLDMTKASALVKAALG